jgi:hypothetical protein
MKEVCREGAGEGEAKVLCHQMAGEGSVIGDTEVLVLWVKGFQGSVAEGGDLEWLLGQRKCVCRWHRQLGGVGWAAS